METTKEELRIMALRLPKETKDQFQSLCKRRASTSSQYLRMLIEQTLKAEEAA